MYLGRALYVLDSVSRRRAKTYNLGWYVLDTGALEIAVFCELVEQVFVLQSSERPRGLFAQP
jgi:hypothetical protein